MTDYEFPGFRVAGSPTWVEARGDLVTTADGQELFDLSMGFGACLFGHRAPEIEQAVIAQAGRLTHALGDLHGSDVRAQAARELCEFAAGNWGPRQIAADQLRALVVGSGSEAVETALKTAVHATGKPHVVAFEGCYHGLFGLGLAATHRPYFRAGVEPFFGGNVRWAPWDEVPTLDEQVACVIVEPIQGRAGIRLPSEGFLEALRAECTRVGALLVVDSILVGCGRAGVPLLGAGLDPDVICVGKALGGGVPIGATIARAEVASAAWDRGGAEATHTATFLAHPLACAAAIATLRLLGATDLDEACARIERLVRDMAGTKLEVRGQGALWALDTGADGEGLQLAAHLLDAGFVCVPAGERGEAIMLTPSLHCETERARADLLDVAARFVPAGSSRELGG